MPSALPPPPEGTSSEIRRRLWAFYRWCADAQIPELTTLAETIETWWPAIEVFLTTGPDERPDRGHEQVDQAGETRRLRVPEPGQLPATGTVALHPANPPIVSEEPDGARPKLKSRFRARGRRLPRRPAARRRPRAHRCTHRPAARDRLVGRGRRAGPRRPGSRPSAAHSGRDDSGPHRDRDVAVGRGDLRG